jgi:hypothetical protein
MRKQCSNLLSPFGFLRHWKRKLINTYAGNGISDIILKSLRAINLPNHHVR